MWLWCVVVAGLRFHALCLSMPPLSALPLLPRAANIHTLWSLFYSYTRYMYTLCVKVSADLANVCVRTRLEIIWKSMDMYILFYFSLCSDGYMYRGDWEWLYVIFCYKSTEWVITLIKFVLRFSGITSDKRHIYCDSCILIFLLVWI